MPEARERQTPTEPGPGPEAMLGWMMGGMQAVLLLQLEAVSFTARRLRAQLAAGERLAHCRSPQEASAVTAQFWQGAAADGAAFATRAVAVLQDAAPGAAAGRSAAPSPGAPSGRTEPEPPRAHADAPATAPQPHAA